MKNSKHLLFNSVATVRVAGGGVRVRRVAAPKVDRTTQIDAMFARLHSSNDFTLERALEDYADVIAIAAR